jgi:hypothetical protein
MSASYEGGGAVRSGTFRIRFAPDMPSAAVEVVNPGLETMDRVWLSPGRSIAITVPSDGTFLRVHLPAGQVVTMKEPGQVETEISLSALRSGLTVDGQILSLNVPFVDARTSKRLRSSADRLAFRSVSLALEAQHTARLKDGTEVTTTSSSGEPAEAIVGEDGRGVSFRFPSDSMSYDLVVKSASNELRVRLPGGMQDLSVDAEEVADRRLVTVRAATRIPDADALGAYITRGDFYSAASMTSESYGAKEGADPSAAALNAYVLLRLRRFDLMQEWVRNLADRWPDLADGGVLWAWQLIHQRGPESEIRARLLKAAAESLPVFTEGLKLLGDGLRLIEARKELTSLNARVGVVLWGSPFTTVCRALGRETGDSQVRFDVGYAPQVSTPPIARRTRALKVEGAKPPKSRDGDGRASR